MNPAEVWEAPTQHSASTIPQERVMKLDAALSDVNRHFIAFQNCREVDDFLGAAIAIRKLADDLSTAAPLARLIQRDANRRSPVPTKE